MALDCDHPRANIALPPSSPARLTWQPPALIPGLPPEAQRVIRESLQGIYDELTRLAATGTIVPLLDDLIYALPGQTIQGVANGQEIILPLPRPGAKPISIVVDDVAHPATVVHPDGTVTTIDKPGVVELYPGVEDWIPPLGLAGAPGIQGPPGADGQDGVGIAGPQGERGRDGGPGIQGPPGRDGEDGLTVVGPEGRPGRDGVQGIQGPPGADGEDGVSIAGPQGPPGRDGAPGIQGPPGNDGDDGISVVGPPGSPGRDGAPGLQGPPGADGEDGVSVVGPQGAAGRDGAPGIQGPPGADGRDGVDGADAVINPNSVSNAELANVPSPSLKGRTTPGTGDPEDLILVNSTTIEWNTSTGGSISTDFRDSVGMSVVGRAPNTTGDVADITVPVTTGGRFLRTNTTGWPSTNPTAPSLIGWGVITNPDLQPIPHNRFLANVTGADAPPAQVDFYFVADGSRGLEFDPADTVFFVKTGTGSTLFIHTDGTVQREAITGDVSVPQFSNTAAIVANAVDNTKLADMAPGRVKGVQVDGSTGDPQDLTGDEVGELLRRFNGVVDSTSSGSIATYAIVNTTTQVRFTGAAAVSIHGMTATSATFGKTVEFHVEAGAAAVITFVHESASAGASSERNRTPTGIDLVLRANESVIATYWDNRWRFTGVAKAAAVADRDYGDVTVSGGGLTWTIDNDVVTNAKAANMADSTIKGRAAGAGTGDPTDLTGAQVGQILRLSTQEDGPSTVGTYEPTLNATTTIYRVNPAAGDELTFTGFSFAGGNAGKVFLFLKQGGDGRAIIQHSAGVVAVNGAFCPYEQDFILSGANAACIVWYQTSSGRWEIVGAKVADRDYGDITVTVGGHTWTIDNNVVTNAKLADMAVGRVKGLQIDAGGTGDPVDLTGAEQGENVRFNTRQTVSVSGTVDIALNDDATILVLQLTADTTLRSLSNTATGDGRLVRIEHDSGSAFTLTFGHNMATPTYFPLYNSDEADMAVRRGATTTFRSRSGFWRPEYPSTRMRVRRNSTGTVFDRGRLNLIEGTGITLTVADDSAGNEVDVTVTNVLGADGDKGDITVSSTGAVWTIDNDVVTNAKLRDSAAVSVIGRAPNSSGDPADIAAAANDRLLARASDTLSFQQLTDGMVPSNTIGLTKLSNILDNRFLGNISGATGAVTAVDFGSLNSTSIIYESTGKTLVRQALTGDVTALQNNNATTIAVNVVDNTKLADMAQSRVKGRAEGAGTGDPTDLTPTQVVSIIDGESPVWSASHRFDSYVQFGSSSVPIAGDIRKGSASVLDIRSSNGIQLCGFGGVLIYGATPSNAGTLIIGDGGGGDARLIATPITGATNPELQMDSHVGTEAINNVTRGVNTAFSSTVTDSTQIALVPAVSIPAGSWRVGRTYTAIGHVMFSRGAIATACNLRSIHGLSGGYTETLDIALPSTTSASYTYRLEYSLTCLSVGSSGSFMHSMRIVGGENNTTASSVGSVDTSPHTVNTTTSQTITVQVNMTATVTNLGMTRSTGYITRTF